MTQANLEVVFDHPHARRSHDLARMESQLDPHVVHQGVVRMRDFLTRQEAMTAAGGAAHDWV